MRPDLSPSRRDLLIVSGAAGAAVLVPFAAEAANQSELTASSLAALERLYQVNDKARAIGKAARAVLVFPKIVKAGFIVGGMGGEGALLQRGRAVGFYSIGGASYGLQAGGQSYSYALFFMKDSAVAYLKSSEGWAIGSGPTVVVADKGFTKGMDTTTLTQDVYAVGFGSKGLMAGLGLQGTKITPIHPKP